MDKCKECHREGVAVNKNGYCCCCQSKKDDELERLKMEEEFNSQCG